MDTCDSDDTCDSCDSCDSCGIEGEPLADVHRVYVTPEAWDAEPSRRPLADVERWCFVCLTHYPHEPA